MKTYVLGPNAARKLKGLFAGQGKVSSRKMSSPGVAFDSEYVAPFTVQWAQSANDGAGAWIIWLPSDSLLDVSGDRIDVSADLDPAGGDYPKGWFALTDDMIDASAGGVLYLNITRGDGESGEDTSAEFSNEDGYGENEGEDDDDGVISIAICQALVDSSDGSRNVKQFVTSTIVVGSMPTLIAGDTESSEWINTEGKRILIQGYPGNAGETEDVDHSGLTFTTVSEREDEDGGKIPAKIIVGVKDKLTSESWAAKTMTVPISGGGTKIVHFLGCDDVDLTQGGGGGGSSGVVGSEYIDVDQEEDEEDPNKTHDVVKAKIATPDAVPSAEDARHALLTNDTDQNVRSAKTFLGSGQPSSSSRIIIDGPRAKLQAKSADGNKTVEVDAAAGNETLTNGLKKIVLDPSAIPDECQEKEISVKKLKVTHRYAKDGKASETYHILGCDDVEIAEGDIKKLTFKKTGSPDVEFDGTADKTVEMTVRNLVAGSGISLKTVGNNITITNTAQGGGGGGGTTDGYTGTAPWLDGFKYDKTANKLMYRFGKMRFENGLAVEYTPGGDSDFVDVPGGDAVEETV